MAKDKKTAAFRNVRVLRYLLLQLPSAATQFFSLLGRGLGVKRRLDTYQKQSALLVGEAIAKSLTTQLDPWFLRSPEAFVNRKQFLETRFAYLVVVLVNVYHVILDMSPSADFKQCITFVVLAFKKAQGLELLRAIGEEFFDELKSCVVSDDTIQSMTAANSGLKITLDIFDYLTSARCVAESSQSNTLKNPDRGRPYFFIPSQFLLELRLEALPLARMIWDSDYADQASKAVVEKLIAVLRHVLSGEQELDAFKTADDIVPLPPHTPKRFPIPLNQVDALKSQGFSEDLVREALFRCNGNPTFAEEYCKAYAKSRKLRNPIPAHETVSVILETRGPSLSARPISLGPPTDFNAVPAPTGQLDSNANQGVAAIEEFSSTLPQQPGSAGPEDLNRQEEQAQGTVSADSNLPTAVGAAMAMSFSNLLNQAVHPVEHLVSSEGTVQSNGQSAIKAATSQNSVTTSSSEAVSFTIESIDSERESIREELAERCLNVLNNHNDVTFELSELLLSATRKLPEDEAKEFRVNVAELVVNSLLSLQTDDVAQLEGKKVAAYSHFTALLLQDKDMYKDCLKPLQDSFQDLLGFVQISQNQRSANDDSWPWIGQVLLVVEKMLSDDAEPRTITWSPPASIDAPLILPPLPEKQSVLGDSEKDQLLNALLDILPRVGKDKSLALSAARILVILSRKRGTATILGEKRNLQRLFVMVKQLANGVDDRLQSALMLILRHIIEDDDTLRQIMRSEIVANFDTRSSRQTDTTAYVRQMYHLVLRSPELFIEVTNEKLKLQRYDGHHRSYNLVLKDSATEKEESKSVNPVVELMSMTEPTDAAPGNHASIEAESTGDGAKAKIAEIKAPVIEHPDGVIHFLLSELLSYKEVDDKEITPTAAEKSKAPPDLNAETDTGNGTFSDAVSESDIPAASVPGKPEKVPFKGEDHPIFIYRCFLLQSLTELLHSYNRTKVEFINFSRKADPLVMTPSKPRSGVLNYLLNGLIPTGSLEPEDSVSFKKRSITSEWAMKVVVALCSKTGELGLIPSSVRYSEYQRVADNDDEPDLSFVRRFVLEHAVKAFKDANVSSEPLQVKYTRMLCLADLFQKMLSRQSGSEGSVGSNNSQKTMSKMMFEKNLISVLTTSLAEIDLSLPGSKRVVKYILRPLNELTQTAWHLSLNSSTTITSALGASEEDVISSASSVSELEDEREETPDLFRNSTLGMLEPNRRDGSSSESEEEDDDDDMYEDDYADEMEYDEAMPTVGQNDGEVVSDEDIDEDLRGPGPIEGLPGDIPMDIELVMDDPHMDIDSDDDDGDDDEDDDDESDADDDGEDFLVEGDEDVMEGETNGDNENDSLDDGVEGDEEWQSDEDDEGENAEGDLDGESQEGLEELLDPGHAVGEDGGDESGHEGQLNNLLQILGENPTDADERPTATHGELLMQAGMDDDMPGDDDEDDEEGDELDENDDDMTYQTFNDMLNNDMLNDPDTPWPWDEAPPFLRGNHRHFRTVPGHLTSFMGRQINSQGLPMPAIHRSHRHSAPIRTADDGTNPLLQRPGGGMPAPTSAISSPTDFIQGFNPGFAALFAPGSGHGGVLDAIMEAVSRGDGRIEMTNRHGHYDIRVDTSPEQIRQFLRPPATSTFPRSTREDPYRAVAFTASMTMTRWQEEARLLYGNNYVEKTQFVVATLLYVLIPPAIDEEKARRKKIEEDNKREEEERVERERQERLEIEEAEKKKKEEEEREAAARVEAEEAAAAAHAEEASQSTDPGHDNGDEADPMQDVQVTETGPVASVPTGGEESTAAQSEAGPTQAAPRVYATLRGRQVDITDMSIDAEYLDALPEELREEVIMQQFAEQRHQAEEQGQPSSEINAEFLAALPDDIREEIVQQEAQDRRRREREAARRRATEAGGPARPEEMDADSFMATLDPSLRRSILADQSDEILQQLAPEYAAEARAIISRQLHHYGRLPVGRDVREDRDTQEQTSSKQAKKQVVQMVDKAGVATLMRLMFMPQQGSVRNNLYHVLQSICGHRQTRAEVISLLLLVLKDGSADVSAVERSLAHLSLRAKTSAMQKTPQPLRRTLSLQANATTNEEMTPLMVVQNCLGALSSLTQYDVHVASVFLRELDNPSAAKSKGSRKGKAKETRASKFALNDLISLLDRNLITENSSCMETLSFLLATITQPLTWLLKKERDKSDDASKIEETNAQNNGELGSLDALTGSSSQPASNVEVVEVEPTSPDAPMAEAISLSDPTISATSEPAANQDGESGVNAPEDPADTVLKAGESKTNEHELKSRKWFDPPVVPDENLRLVVGIFAGRECNAKTFREALTAILNLSLIPGARDVFGKELVTQAQVLSQAILSDLEVLLPKIRDAKSGTDLQGIATSKFSPASSDQAKLLRVLTALDYIFDPKRPENKERMENETTHTGDILTTLYESPSFNPLWSKLSECLSAIRQKENILSLATILLPLIESLMLVCKNTSLKDEPLVRQIREHSVATPIAESPNSLEYLFFNFTTEHRKILNELVRQNSKLMSGSFSLLVKNPKVLEFDNKRSYFNRQIHSRHREARHPQPPLQLSVRRDQVFLDSYRSLYFKSADEMKYGKLSIRFHGEEGVDAGGVTREWFQVLSRGMFNPGYALFVPVTSDRTTFHPSRLSGVNPEHLMFFKFIGRVIGKALYENRVLDCHFSRAVYKSILGRSISVKDMESLDLDYYKSLVWMLENDITEVLVENFAVESDDFGASRIIDLIENGRNIPVTEENKQQYVQLIAEHRLVESVKEQLDNFLKGFHDIIPAELISIFNEQELELLISGLPDINVDDWKANTEYHNYSASSQQIQWFWR